MSQVQNDGIRDDGSAEPKLPSATHSGNLKIGNSVLPCAVLEDGTRVLARSQFVQAIGRKGKVSGGRQYDQDLQTPVFLTAKNLQPYISSEMDEMSKPVLFDPTAKNPVIGYRAELLPLVWHQYTWLTKSREL